MSSRPVESVRLKSVGDKNASSVADIKVMVFDVVKGIGMERTWVVVGVNAIPVRIWHDVTTAIILMMIIILLLLGAIT